MAQGRAKAEPLMRQVQPDTTVSVGSGTPVYLRTETTVPSQPPANPMMALENWAPVLALILAAAAVLTLFTKSITGKIGEFAASHKLTHDALDKNIHGLRNDLASTGASVRQLEQFRNADVERIVRLETNLHNIEKGQERIENTLEKNAAENAKGRAEIIDNLREWRGDKFKA